MNLTEPGSGRQSFGSGGPDLPLLGYASRWSVSGGEPVQFMVSCAAERYDVQIVRVTGRGPRPEGEGDPLTWEPVPSDVAGSYPGRVHQTVSGSYGIVDRVGDPGRQGATLTAWVYPTLTSAGRRQVILAWPRLASGPGQSPGPDPAPGAVFSDHSAPSSLLAPETEGVELALDEQGRLALSCVWGPGQRTELVTQDTLPERTWSFVGGSVDFGTGRMRLLRHLAGPEKGRERTVVIETGADHATADWAGSDSAGPLGYRVFVAAAGTGPHDPAGLTSVVTGGYNGKIEWAGAHSRPFGAAELLSCADTRPSQSLLAAARLVNAPMEQMTGHRWSGRVLDWRLAPAEYEAVWFHDDDLADARWPVCFEWRVPVGIRSGMYAAIVRAQGSEDVISFYVRPSAGQPSARLAVLIPTFTYTVYSNFAGRPGRSAGADAEPDPGQLAEAFLAEHPELGLSLYCTHRDGSGVSHVSSRRPMVDQRPWHRLPARGNAGRELSGDLYLLDWLEAQRFGYDIVTDHDLHAEGAAALERYPCVITGGHPEYYSEPMLDGVRDYIERGGNVAYLGGNGFYWVTEVSPRDPDVLEVRRGRSGSRTWTGEPGEGHHSWSGEPGGLWRDRGRAPQALVGVGFDAQGGGDGSGYVRTPDSEDPSVAFVFAGIGSHEVIGDFGLKLGAAAGDELDRADAALGTPPGTLLIATSAGLHSDRYQRAVEEVQEMNPQQGGTQSPYVRADITYYECPGGGSVFSVGSICWSTSLSHANYSNNVSRMTANVLNEFTQRLGPHCSAQSPAATSGAHAIT